MGLIPDPPTESSNMEGEKTKSLHKLEDLTGNPRQEPHIDPEVATKVAAAKKMTEEEWLRIFGPVYKEKPGDGTQIQLHDVPAFKARCGDKPGIPLWNAFTKMCVKD